MSYGECPHCGGAKVRCMNSRPSRREWSVRDRTYECLSCGRRFQTEERIVRIEGEAESDLRTEMLREIDIVIQRYTGTGTIRPHLARCKIGRRAKRKRSIADAPSGHPLHSAGSERKTK